VGGAWTRGGSRVFPALSDAASAARPRRRLPGLLIALGMLGQPGSAQWLHYPTPGIPRTPDGKANLSAPTPRADGKPDLSGIWMRSSGKYLANLAAGLKPEDVQFQPWAAKLFDERAENLAKDRPTARCIPHGVPDQMAVGYPFKIIQTPGLVMILYEEMTHFRQIFTDGRQLPKDPNPTLLGYSVGHWEGDALVIDTAGFNEVSWLDDPGHPHTDALHITERFERKDFGHMAIQITIDDQKAYRKPWSVTETFDFLPDTELLENVCENEKDVRHLVGK
jgi:hypothetical protein